MTIENDAYRDKLRETLRLRKHVQKLDVEISQLINHPSLVPELSDLKSKLSSLEDQKLIYNFMYKTQLDEFMAVCEDMLKNQAPPEIRIAIRDDLLQAGYDLVKDGINHPHLKQLVREVNRANS